MSDSPRPLYFISRGNGILTPLIAADELPQFLKIVGVPATIAMAETANMVCLGERYHSGNFYAVQLTGSSPIDSLEKLSAKATGVEATLRPAANHPPMGRFHTPGGEMLAGKIGISGPNDIENWRQGVQTVNNTQVYIIHLLPKERIFCAKNYKAVIDSVVAANEQHIAPGQERSPPAPTATSPPRTQATAASGIYGKKIYCTYYLKTGDCHYQQQGCLYKHEMPDQKTLNDIGIRTRPDWHIKQCGYNWQPEKPAAIEQSWRAPIEREASLNQQVRKAPSRVPNGFGQHSHGHGQTYNQPQQRFLPLTGQQKNFPAACSPGYHASNLAAQHSPFPAPYSPSSHPTYTASPTNIANTYMAPTNTAAAAPTAANMYIAPPNTPSAIANLAAAKMQQPLPLTSEPSKPHIPSTAQHLARLEINEAPKIARPVDRIKPLTPSPPSVSPTKGSDSESVAYVAKSDSTAQSSTAESFTASASPSTLVNTEKPKCVKPASPNPMHRRFFIAPGESPFVQNPKEEKPRRHVSDDWMAKEKLAAEKAKREAVGSNGASGKKCVSGYADGNGNSNGNGNGNGNGNPNPTINAATFQAKTSPSPPGKGNAKCTAGKNPSTWKNPKSKSPKGKAGVKGKGTPGAKVLGKEEDLLVDFGV